MKLKKILKNVSGYTIKGSKEVEITGISSNSKFVAPGNLYLAKKGFTSDGAKFIPEAVASGAVAVASDIYDPFLKDVVQIIHPSVAEIEPYIAEAYYQSPDKELFLIGITGTNGKTTTSYLVKHLLDSCGVSCGLIGTIEAIIGNNYLPSTRTTPDVLTNYKFLHDMRLNQNRAACMEVTSHGLDQGRVANLDFDIAIFTNLTLDHLDYHKSFNEYAAAKAKLFSSLSSSSHKKGPKKAIVNNDSPWSKAMLEGCKTGHLTYGITNKADVMASNIVLDDKSIHFDLDYEGSQVPFSCPLVGRFNVYNCLAAISVGIVLGIPMQQIVAALESFSKVPGRLERVPNKKGLPIYVDYAHSDDSLRNVLVTLKEFTKGRLITVFGCGGNRDISKRPLMGRVAEELSDAVIVTNDNPRNENPEHIISDILKGFADPLHAVVEMDRFEAIKKAIQMAKRDDVILIAGKGHETYQIFSNQTTAFDDRKVAKEICEMLSKK